MKDPKVPRCMLHCRLLSLFLLLGKPYLSAHLCSLEQAEVILSVSFSPRSPEPGSYGFCYPGLKACKLSLHTDPETLKGLDVINPNLAIWK